MHLCQPFIFDFLYTPPYKCLVPNKRAENQTLIAFACDRELLRLVDENRGSKSRSIFVRESIVEELRRLGVSVPKGLVEAPDRAKAIRYQSGRPVSSNSSALVEEARKAASAGEKALALERQLRQRSRAAGGPSGRKDSPSPSSSRPAKG